MFLRQGVSVIGIGLALGLGGALAGGRMLQNQVYGVRAFDIPTLAGACILMGVAGVWAIWWPAGRAARQSPLAVLKAWAAIPALLLPIHSLNRLANSRCPEPPSPQRGAFPKSADPTPSQSSPSSKPRI